MFNWLYFRQNRVLRRGIGLFAFAVMGLMFLFALLLLPIESTVQAQGLPEGCNGGGDYGSFITEDTTWSGEVYLGRKLTVRESTLTIMPGTQVFFCGEFSLAIGDLFNPARLVAVGSVSEPIVFDSAVAGMKWESLYFGDAHTDGSIVQYVELKNGGGNDPMADVGVLQISNRSYVMTRTTPVVDYMTITGSGAYGVRLDVNEENDYTPAALTNLTISGSAAAPIISDAAGVSGFGQGLTFSNNITPTIQVRGNNLNGGMFFDQHWRKHALPYEILGSLYIRNNLEDEGKPFSTWTIDPGVTILVHPEAGFTIGSLYGDARLVANGTEDEPITITRLNESSNPWAGIGFDAWSKTNSELSHVKLHYGGDLANEEARHSVLKKDGTGSLSLDHVEVWYSQNTGLYSTNGDFDINASSFRLNRVGIDVFDTDGVIRNSSFINHAQSALINRWATTHCIDAVGNYWGDANGPADTSNESDACHSTRTNNSSGNAVSDGVLYWPWYASESGELTNRSSISPAQAWVIGNGVDSTEIVVTVRDQNGNPLAGKTVELEATRGTLVQPTAPTDANGVTRASISSSETGEAIITGQNTTDNQPLAAQAALYFWQGAGDTGGLAQLSGAPYAYPQLVVEGEPFQIGFPVIFRLPMQNTRAQPLNVEVTYSVSNFGIGQRYTPASTIQKTLQPGDSWDAPGGFTPPDETHRCVQFDVTYGLASRLIDIEGNGRFTGSKNLKRTPPGPDTCDKPNPFKLIPTKPGLGGVKKHGKNLKKQGGLVNECIKTQVNSRHLSGGSRDYETVVTAPTYTAPTLSAGSDVSQAEADASNTLAQTAADLTELNIALSITRNRMDGASQAGEWHFAAVQYETYQAFQRQRAQLLDQYADQIATYLQVYQNAGNQDVIFTPEDYRNDLIELQNNGYDAETLAYYRDSGFSQELIDYMLQQEIEAFSQSNLVSTSFFEIMQNAQQEARETASELRSFYGTGTNRGGNENMTRIRPIETSFVVGNPTDSTATVNLVVRPVDLPMNWSYKLDQTSVELTAGQEISATLTLNPGDTPVLKDVDVRVAVEGWIGEQHIGGVIIQQRVPVMGQATDNMLYLPITIR